MKDKKKTIVAAGFALCGIFSALAETNITGAVTLDADADWSASGPVRFSSGASIDLAGNSLKCAGFAEYVELDHVDTDGNQWINTGYKTANASANTPGGGDKVEIKFQMKDVETQQFLLCARTSDTSNFGCYMNKGGMLNFGYRTVSGAGTYATKLELDTDYTVTIDYNNKTFRVNGDTTDFSGTLSGQKALTGYDVSLFCSQNAGNNLDDNTSVANMAKCRFYYMKIWDKYGNLKVDLVPALGVNENKVGLYDRVRNRFLAPLENGGEATAFADDHYELDYLDTDGEMYVDTGVVPTSTNRFEMTVAMLKGGAAQSLFHLASNASLSQCIYLRATAADKFQFRHANKFVKTVDDAFALGTKYELVLNPDPDTPKTEGIVNGTVETSVDSFNTSLKPAKKCFLFANNYDNEVAGDYATCRFYSFKIYENCNKETLQHYFVPVFRTSDSTYCLYDRVAKTYKNASGDGGFIPPGGVVKNTAATAATLEVCVDEGESAVNSCIRFEGDIDFVKSGDGEWVCAEGLDVGGSFALNGGTVGGVTMQNESVLDFSARTTPLDLDTCGLAFASGATIYVAVGNRSVTASAPLASWTAAPSGVTFKRDPAAPQRFSVSTTETGLYAAYRGLIISFH